jgi:hypothetical protein
MCIGKSRSGGRSKRQRFQVPVPLLQASVDQLSQALAQSEWVLDRWTCPLLADVVLHLLQLADQNHNNKYQGNGLVYRETEELDSEMPNYVETADDDECVASQAACSSQFCSLLLTATFLTGLVVAYFLPQEEPPLFF